MEARINSAIKDAIDRFASKYNTERNKVFLIIFPMNKDFDIGYYKMVDSKPVTITDEDGQEKIKLLNFKRDILNLKMGIDLEMREFKTNYVLKPYLKSLSEEYDIPFQDLKMKIFFREPSSDNFAISIYHGAKRVKTTTLKEIVPS